jgi:hypothetical protein
VGVVLQWEKLSHECGAWSGSGEQGIITFSAEWLGNLLSFFEGNTYDRGHRHFFTLCYF